MKIRFLVLARDLDCMRWECLRSRCFEFCVACCSRPRDGPEASFDAAEDRANHHLLQSEVLGP